jgi:hypothetical protein
MGVGNLLGDKVGSYIERLTDNVIGTHRYYELADRLSPDEFASHIELDLEIKEVIAMTSQTRARIICDLGDESFLALDRRSRERERQAMTGEERIREMAVLCLVYVIRERLYPTAATKIPPYRRPQAPV